MNINDMKTSRFIKKEDLPAPPYGKIVTVRGLDNANVAPDNAKPDMKYIIHFYEMEKPFVTNVTNRTSIAMILGSEETDNWTNGLIELYYDPSVMMGSERKGGIRVRPPTQIQQGMPPQQQPMQQQQQPMQQQQQPMQQQPPMQQPPIQQQVSPQQAPMQQPPIQQQVSPQTQAPQPPPMQQPPIESYQDIQAPPQQNIDPDFNDDIPM